MKNTKIQDVQRLIWTLLSGTLYSFNIVSLTAPHGLYPSGFSGLSRLISDLSHDFLPFTIPFNVPYLLLNFFSVLLVYKNIGKKFTFFSSLQILTVALLTSIIKPVYFTDDILLASVFGGIIGGFAIVMALQHNSSSGGTDFIAIYISNKYHVSSWNGIMVFNVLILSIAGLVYGWEKALYSIIYQFCSTQVIKNFHNRFTHETITIITRMPDEVISSILANTRHGITVEKAQGAYLHQDESVLYMVVNSFETPEVLKSALKIDPHAFINIQDSKRVVGNFYQKPLD